MPRIDAHNTDPFGLRQQFMLHMFNYCVTKLR